MRTLAQWIDRGRNHVPPPDHGHILRNFLLDHHGCGAEHLPTGRGSERSEVDLPSDFMDGNAAAAWVKVLTAGGILLSQLKRYQGLAKESGWPERSLEHVFELLSDVEDHGVS